MKLTKTFKSFFNNEKSGGLLLLFVTIISLYLANSSFQTEYIAFWETDLNGHSITHWINDGLMAIFFLLIGLELEREIYHGELSSIKNASLPIMAAFGGMLIPAVIFLALNFGSATQNGAGIPMATDIAFAIGILSLLGNKVPASLKVFLTALAVIDDLGAIIVIAIFYTTTIAFVNLAIALGIWAFLFVLNRMKVQNLIPYLIGGVIMWYFMLNSGVHATITGVILAFVIPFGDGGKNSSSYKLQHFLHKPVAFVILPLFAIANTCIAIQSDWHEGLSHSNTLGIILGLVVGKPLGIILFSAIGVSAGFCSLPKSLKWAHILGAGMLGGIGFTMSIFITILAFHDPEIIVFSKIAILIASILSGLFGFVYLKYILTRKKA
ncbi:Na+/H+ antiporter NhaA [Flavobacterium hibernum]|uniref:Na(+)/H(+) antiporter NhaA n=1 Tax=Flavobacterium hibernum TaxID=37752 RepID=A0A0D0EDH0_9FLAO|nr:Na+/H+ antiporter NhaA [Flavobacterium hibernum]KIO50589.1 pH-dependent sodium/proton antiporter [Flavobacterium hibernum]OXA87454.1 Na+/H+ antiporter NhaA [Flavobacterium hibernum]STO14322.1 Sodium/proton antiporter nhaA [Flavobacterium hibernum]